MHDHARFQNAILAQSQAQDFHQAIKEWRVAGHELIEGQHCACLHPINHCYKLLNKITGEMLAHFIGSECIKTFADENPDLGRIRCRACNKHITLAAYPGHLRSPTHAHMEATRKCNTCPARIPHGQAQCGPCQGGTKPCQGKRCRKRLPLADWKTFCTPCYKKQRR